MVTSSLDSVVLCFSKSHPTSLQFRIQSGLTKTIKKINIPGVWFEGGVVAGMTAMKQNIIHRVQCNLFIYIQSPQ